MSDERSGRGRPRRTPTARPTPAGLVADGLRRRRESRQATVRLHDPDGMMRTLPLGDPVAEALRRAAAACADALESGEPT